MPLRLLHAVDNTFDGKSTSNECFYMARIADGPDLYNMVSSAQHAGINTIATGMLIFLLINHLEQKIEPKLKR